MNKKLKIFIIGWDEFNYEQLKHLPEADEYEFLPAIYFSEMRGVKNLSIPRMLNIAEERINEAGNMDAIVSFFDFPGTVLLPIFAKKYNLTGPSLQSVIKCEHKFWSRLEQQKAIPANIPRFISPRGNA